MFSKNGTRFLIFVVLLASCFIMVLSAKAVRPMFWVKCSVGEAPFYAFWDSKTHAKATFRYQHAYTFLELFVIHNHRVSYSLYARVAEDVDRNPDHGGYGNIIIKSTKRFLVPYKEKSAKASGYPRWENDAYASASASESGNPNNWKFCPELEDVN